MSKGRLSAVENETSAEPRDARERRLAGVLPRKGRGPPPRDPCRSDTGT